MIEVRVPPPYSAVRAQPAYPGRSESTGCHHDDLRSPFDARRTYHQPGHSGREPTIQAEVGLNRVVRPPQAVRVGR